MKKHGLAAAAARRLVRDGAGIGVAGVGGSVTKQLEKGDDYGQRRFAQYPTGGGRIWLPEALRRPLRVPLQSSSAHQ